MSLNARKILEDQKNAGNLCWTFNVASETDMEALGRTFAGTVLPAVSSSFNTGLRIGLDSWSAEKKLERHIGKTTFCQGVLSAIENKKSIESTTKHNGFKQDVWQSPETGTIRHYDCLVSWRHGVLPSYRDQKTDFGDHGPTIDLVENAYADMYNKEFDFLFTFRKAGTANQREVTFVVTPEMAKLPAVEEFLTQSAQWRHVPDANPYIAPKQNRSGLSASL